MALFDFIMGFTKVSHIDVDRMPVYARNEPGGTSVINGLHWVQNIRSGKFERFDLGSKEKNMLKYGQETVPSYDLERMARNIRKFNALYIAGETDYLSTPKDFKHMQKV